MGISIMNKINGGKRRHVMGVAMSVWCWCWWGAAVRASVTEKTELDIGG